MRIKFLGGNTLRGCQRGDTIVEVLIAIAVVSSVLGITYSIMNKNIQTTRDNQERSEASKVVQGQVELLRSLWFSKSVAGFEAATNSVTNAPFCVHDDMTTKSISDTSILEIATPGYPAECVKQDLYYVSIVENSSIDKSYTITAKWNSLNGHTSQVVMAYKVK